VKSALLYEAVGRQRAMNSVAEIRWLQRSAGISKTERRRDEDIRYQL